MTPHDRWTLDALIEAYRQHQRRTRGLRDQTLRGYERLARLLVRVVLGDDPIDPTRLNPSDVMAFVASMRGRYSLGLTRFGGRLRAVASGTEVNDSRWKGIFLGQRGQAVVPGSKTGRNQVIAPILMLAPQVKLPKPLSLVRYAERARQRSGAEGGAMAPQGLLHYAVCNLSVNRAC